MGIRQAAREGLEVRDRYVEMAYFAIAAQVADKLRIQINIPYSSKVTLKLYTVANRTIWASIKEK